MAKFEKALVDFADDGHYDIRLIDSPSKRIRMTYRVHGDMVILNTRQGSSFNLHASIIEGRLKLVNQSGLIEWLERE